MDMNAILDYLDAKWREYLIQHGHHIYKTTSRNRTIKSRNRSNNLRYRWLLYASQSPERVLTKAEESNIRRNLRQARKRGEFTFLVIEFTSDPKRTIVIPAILVRKTRHIYSDKGGICLD
jgi:hypothetical protein